MLKCCCDYEENYLDSAKLFFFFQSPCTITHQHVNKKDSTNYPSRFLSQEYTLVWNEFVYDNLSFHILIKLVHT